MALNHHIHRLLMAVRSLMVIIILTVGTGNIAGFAATHINFYYYW